MPSIPDKALSCSIRIADESELPSVALALAAALPERAFVTLEGDLGAGKTTFVKAIAAAVGIDPGEVLSPTFGLIHVYDLPRSGPTARLVHADMYRLGAAADLHETGWDDAIAGPCWVFVEWPRRIAAALPADRLDLTIDIDSETGRTITALATLPVYGPAISSLKTCGTRSG
jgi:tRNA threonylcarbamoyl adenosine modification protein YjeE